jgi:uncharacterized protein YdbL (DUF1318 family)
MMKPCFQWIVLIAFCGLFCGMSNLHAQGGMDLKQRTAIIKGLKVKGIVGENNQGYLEFRGAKTAEAVVEAENAHRRQAYREIAEKQGASTEEVGRQRAIQLAESASSGEWIQKADGTWIKKP